MSDKPLSSIHARDVHGYCPACGNPTLTLGDDGRITCTLMDCPRPDLVNELIGDIADARSHRAYTFCSQLVGHVTMTAFAKKITEKVTAVAYRKEAVAYANEQKQRAERAEAELVALRKEQDEYEETVVGDLNEANIGLARQAARAEASITRVRKATAHSFMAGPNAVDVVRVADVLAALDEPKER